jgi:hypothetical protein
VTATTQELITAGHAHELVAILVDAPALGLRLHPELDHAAFQLAAKEAGLAEVTTRTATLQQTSLRAFAEMVNLRTVVAEATRHSAVTEDAARAWWAALEEADRAGCFLACIVGWFVIGTRP